MLSSGLDRIHKPCSDILKNQILYPGLPVDFYGLFWEPWNQEKMEYHTKGFRQSTLWTAQPRDFSNFEVAFKPPETNVRNFLSMAWGRWLLDRQMTELGLWDQYDIFMYIRPDVCFGNKLFLPSIMHLMDSFDLFMPGNGHWREGINDQVCFGGRKLSIYLKLFEDIPKYMTEGLIFHPEIMLKHHLIRHGINAAEYPLQNFIFRNESWFHIG